MCLGTYWQFSFSLFAPCELITFAYRTFLPLTLSSWAFSSLLSPYPWCWLVLSGSQSHSFLYRLPWWTFLSCDSAVFLWEHRGSKTTSLSLFVSLILCWDKVVYSDVSLSTNWSWGLDVWFHTCLVSAWHRDVFTVLFVLHGCDKVSLSCSVYPTILSILLDDLYDSPASAFQMAGIKVLIGRSLKKLVKVWDLKGLKTSSIQPFISQTGIRSRRHPSWPLYMKCWSLWLPAPVWAVQTHPERGKHRCGWSLVRVSAVERIISALMLLAISLKKCIQLNQRGILPPRVARERQNDVSNCLSLSVATYILIFIIMEFC